VYIFHHDRSYDHYASIYTKYIMLRLSYIYCTLWCGKDHFIGVPSLDTFFIFFLYLSSSCVAFLIPHMDHIVYNPG
jgi:hypothetical protein